MSDETKPCEKCGHPIPCWSDGDTVRVDVTEQVLADYPEIAAIIESHRPLTMPDSIASGWLEDYESSGKNAAPPQTWMACERPGCHHDITTDHEDSSGRCVRLGCACEAALVRVSTVMATARRRGI